MMEEVSTDQIVENDGGGTMPVGAESVAIHDGVAESRWVAQQQLIQCKELRPRWITTLLKAVLVV